MNFNYRSQFNYSYSAKPAELRAKIAFDSSGDVTIQSNTGMGISSISHDAPGVYTITLSRKFGGLMNVRHSFINATAPAAPSLYISSDDVVSAGTLEITLNAAGTAGDPADGEVMMIEIVLNDSSLGY